MHQRQHQQQQQHQLQHQQQHQHHYITYSDDLQIHFHQALFEKNNFTSDYQVCAVSLVHTDGQFLVMMVCGVFFLKYFGCIVMKN